MLDLVEALYEYFDANLSVWELLGVIVMAVGVLVIHRRYPKKWIPYTVFWILFPIYVTTVRRWFGGGGKEVHHGRFASDVLNVGMLVPFGISAFMAMKTIWSQRISKAGMQIGLVTVSGLMISMLVESLQWITGCGMPEVLDLCTNTAGAFLGALMMWLWFKAVKKTK